MRLEDIYRILSERGIDAKQCRNAVNINCPWCIGQHSGQSDDKKRLGIFRSLRYHCFRCHRVGDFSEVLDTVAGVGPDEYARLVKGKDAGTSASARVRSRLTGGEQQQEGKSSIMKPLPGIPLQLLDERARVAPEKFLRRRGYTLGTAISAGCRYTGSAGSKACRLIIPIHDLRGKVAAWQARDITGKSDRRYLTSGPAGQLLYIPPWDTIEHDLLYIVEGVFDAWRIHTGVVASFTAGLTSAQRDLLLTIAPRRIIFAWDSDKWNEALKAARELAPLVESCGAVHLPEGEDPDSIGEDAIRRLPVHEV